LIKTDTEVKEVNETNELNEVSEANEVNETNEVSEVNEVNEVSEANEVKKLKKRRPHKPQKTWVKVLHRVLLCFITFILLLVAGLYSICAVVFKGPSPAARDKLVTSTLEMSAAKWVPRLFFSKEEIAEIKKANAVIESDEITNPGLIVIPPTNDPNSSDNDEWADYPDGIRIENVKGDTFRGYVMIVRDPSKVYLATSSDFKSNQPGLRIYEVLKREGAIAGINAGGFPDAGGNGDGSVPIGLTISKGELLWGNTGTYYTGVIGFTNDNILMVGNMTGQQALNAGMRDCVCFGPILVVNGEAAQLTGSGGSLNPRTAIGQRADGAVILLCVDGRMPGSLGASYADLINVMIEYRAVNAANLDGGSSTHMYYKDNPINVSSSLYGPRKMPTFFMVKE